RGFFLNRNDLLAHNVANAQTFTIYLADNVSLRDNADDHPTCIDDRRAANTLTGKKVCRFLHGGLRADGRHLAGHNLTGNHHGRSSGHSLRTNGRPVRVSPHASHPGWLALRRERVVSRDGKHYDVRDGVAEAEAFCRRTWQQQTHPSGMLLKGARCLREKATTLAQFFESQSQALEIEDVARLQAPLE